MWKFQAKEWQYCSDLPNQSGHSPGFAWLDAALILISKSRISLKSERFLCCLLYHLSFLGSSRCCILIKTRCVCFVHILRVWIYYLSGVPKIHYLLIYRIDIKVIALLTLHGSFFLDDFPCNVWLFLFFDRWWLLDNETERVFMIAKQHRVCFWFISILWDMYT